jgi:hypothetical protein
MANSKGMANMTKPMAADRDLTAAEQKDLILSYFFDGDDGDHFLALCDHAKIDLGACNGDAKQIPNIIAAHYRIAQGRYDLDRAANDLLTFPPIAARIAELKAKKGKGRKR